MRLLLVAAHGEARRRYEADLAALAVDYDAVASLAELRDELTRQAYNGLLLDMPTMLRAPAAEKSLTNDLLDIFPALKMSYDLDTGLVHSMYYGEQGRIGHSLASFIAAEAEPFQARTIRRRRRQDLAACVALQRPGEAHRELAAMVNLSMDGCFVITAGTWLGGQELQLFMADLADQAPIAARCRRVVPWGPGMHLPGIGVSFEAMTAAQKAQLATLLDQEEKSA